MGQGKRFAISSGLIVLSAALLFAAWPPHMFGPLVFVAFVPLLFFYNSIWDKTRLKRYFLSLLATFVTLFLFGYGTSFNAWGEYDDNVHVAAFMSVFPEAFITSFYVFFRKKKWAFLFLILSWGSVEIIQTSWELNAPLFMIGNAMCKFPSLIQHYAIWGVLGGTMQIIAINVVVFYVIQKRRQQASLKKLLLVLALLLLPTVISLVSFQIPKDTKTEKVAIAVGHFDHFTLEYSQQPMLLVNKYNALLKTIDLSDVELVIFPESGIVNGGWIENLNNDQLINPIDSLCPGKEIFVGSHMFSVYDGPDTDSYDIRYQEASDSYFASHNCIVFRNKDGYYSVRSKEKYIPFHETIPYPGLFLFAKDWFNKDAIPTYLRPYPKAITKSFKTSQRLLVNPLMCFESTFTDMALRNNDAHFTLVLANESWNTEERGKRQYNDYLTAKAIESGKGILKVANGGYSSFISKHGVVKSWYGFKIPTVALVDVEVDTSASIYSKIAPSIAFLVLFSTIVLLLVAIIMPKFKKRV